VFYRLSAFSIMAGLCAAAPVSAGAQEAEPTGVWRSADSAITIRIAPCASPTNTFCGTVLQDNRPGPATNPANHVIVRGLRWERQVWRGQVNDGGMTLNFTLRINGPTTALARYCLGILCEEESWSRVRAANNTGQNLRP
jgi:uncharacterized protein (DUF2147 family)